MKEIEITALEMLCLRRTSRGRVTTVWDGLSDAGDVVRAVLPTVEPRGEVIAQVEEVNTERGWMRLSRCVDGLHEIERVGAMKYTWKCFVLDMEDVWIDIRDHLEEYLGWYAFGLAVLLCVFNMLMVLLW